MPLSDSADTGAVAMETSCYLGAGSLNRFCRYVTINTPINSVVVTRLHVLIAARSLEEAEFTVKEVTTFLATELRLLLRLKKTTFFLTASLQIHRAGQTYIIIYAYIKSRDLTVPLPRTWRC